MPRRERTELDHDLLYGRWHIFGAWITHQRLIVGLTQKQAAQAVGLSRRQWIRYELGAKVPLKHMKAMSKILHVTEDKMWDRAQYKISYKHLASKDRLERILDMLSAGKLAMAELQLLRLNDRIRGIEAARGPRAAGLTGSDYANVMVALNDMPRPWVENLLKVMQARIEDKEDQTEVYLKGQRLIRKKREDRIIWPEPLGLCWMCKESFLKEPGNEQSPS